MEFSELKAKDSFNAFFDFIPVREAKESGIIPESFINYFQDRCECGSDMIITRNRKRLMCCNPRCHIKVYKSFHEMITRFNCKNVGEAACRNVIKYAQNFMTYGSHVEVLAMEDKHLVSDTRGMSFVYLKEAISKVRGTYMTFADMVSRLAIPEFDSTALNLFSNISGTKELVERIKEAGGIHPFLSLRGAHDPMKAFYLGEFLMDIGFAEYHVFKRLRAPGKMKITVCITGNLTVEGIRATKSEFIEVCKSIGELPNGIQLFDVEMNTAINSTPYLLADYPSSTAKYKTAKAREQVALDYYNIRLERAKAAGTDVSAIERPHKIVYTADEFIAYLKEVVACVTEEKSLPNHYLL
jgi:hypothetical protein